MKDKKARLTSVKMVLALVSVAVVFAAVLAVVNQVTEPTIERNAREKLYKGVLTVLGFPTSGDYEGRFEEGVETVRLEELTIYKGYRGRELVGYAFRASGGGFQGIVDLVAGVSPDLENLLGVEVLECGDTPGLGGRILEPEFEKQFEGLSTQPRIDFVKYVKPEKQNQFEAITGATFTSIAVRDILNQGLEGLREALEEGG